MTDDEYRYMSGGWCPDDRRLFHDVGEACFENGWTDVFGFVTPSGEKAMEGYYERHQ